MVRPPYKSKLVKRTIAFSGRKTSVSVEDEFWSALKEIARGRHRPIYDLVGSIDAGRDQSNLSSAIRLFVLGVYRDELIRSSSAETMDKLGLNHHSHGKSL